MPWEDDFGFEFDPFDVDLCPHYDPLTDQAKSVNHFRELTYLPSNTWIDSGGNAVRMNKMRAQHIRYLVNIVHWMERNHDKERPYKLCIQYLYAKRRIAHLQKKIVAAQKILGRPMGWSLVNPPKGE